VFSDGSATTNGPREGYIIIYAFSASRLQLSNSESDRALGAAIVRQRLQREVSPKSLSMRLNLTRQDARRCQADGVLSMPPASAFRAPSTCRRRLSSAETQVQGRSQDRR
jgi:hypothetical protein